MPPTTTPPPAGGRRSSPSSSSSGGGLTAWLRTREGKIVAGAGAAVLVVLMALRKSAGGAAGGGGGGFLPSAIQPSYDGTLQGALDQVGGGGGSLSEWTNATTQLNQTVRDLLEAQNPLPPTTPALAAPTGFREVNAGQWGNKQLSWGAIPGVTRYLVRHGGGGSSIVEGTEVDTGVLIPGEHYYEVRPLDPLTNVEGPAASIRFKSVLT